MDWTRVPGGTLNAASQRVLSQLGDQADTVLDRLKIDPDFVKRVAQFMINNGEKQIPLETVSQRDARLIMGPNFFGIRDAIAHFEIRPTEEQCATLAQVPFSEDLLLFCRNSHVLVAVFPLSVMDILAMYPHHFSSRHQPWHHDKQFANNKGTVSWQLVSKEPAADSINQTWKRQQTLVLPEDEIPTAQIVTYAMVAHLLVGNERLFGNVLVRTQDLERSPGQHGAIIAPVAVGDFGNHGMRFDTYGGVNAQENTGVATVKKNLIAA